MPLGSATLFRRAMTWAFLYPVLGREQFHSADGMAFYRTLSLIGGDGQRFLVPSSEERTIIEAEARRIAHGP